MNLLVFFGGLILRVVGASILVRGASKLAMSFGQVVRADHLRHQAGGPT